MRTEIPFAILSAARAEFSAEVNESRHAALGSQLRGRNLDFAAVAGHWQGNAEPAYIVLLPDARALALVLLLASRYAQEAVLLVDANRAAELRTVDYSAGAAGVRWGLAMALGSWREVDDTDGLEAYTETADGRTWHAGP